MKHGFFKGSYFKYTGKEPNTAIAFIPGFHADTRGQRRAFVQLITPTLTHIFPYPGHAFEMNASSFHIRVGDNTFGPEGASIHLRDGTLTCTGDITHGPLSPPRQNVMGPFRFMPGLPCRHSIQSLSHSIDGDVTLAGRVISLSSGLGYIESDCGHSFPEHYTWFAVNGLPGGGAVVAAVASIKALGVGFTGFFALARQDGRDILFATYNGARRLEHTDRKIILEKRGHRLLIDIDSGEGLPLSAPAAGQMTRTIHERVACSARVRLYEGRALMMDAWSAFAGHEYVW